MSQELWAVCANKAGNELATTEVLYSGLTKAQAFATVRSCIDMVDDTDGINYYVARDNGTKGSMGHGSDD